MARPAACAPLVAARSPPGIAPRAANRANASSLLASAERWLLRSVLPLCSTRTTTERPFTSRISVIVAHTSRWMSLPQRTTANPVTAFQYLARTATPAPRPRRHPHGQRQALTKHAHEHVLRQRIVHARVVPPKFRQEIPVLEPHHRRRAGTRRDIVRFPTEARRTVSLFSRAPGSARLVTRFFFFGRDRICFTPPLHLR